jgi:hypothetical protein
VRILVRAAIVMAATVAGLAITVAGVVTSAPSEFAGHARSSDTGGRGSGGAIPGG